MIRKHANVLLLISLCLEASSFTGTPQRHSRNTRIRHLHTQNPNTPSSEDKDQDQDSSTPESLLDRALRKAKARAEIRRLTETDSNPIHDPAHSLAKLLDGISPGLVPNSPESVAESSYHNLETKLSHAVSIADFTSASKLRDNLDSMHIDDCGFVLQANSEFYSAFSKKDYPRMKEVWLSDNTVACVHPSHTPLMGYQSVLKSWEEMFSSSDKTFQMNTMEPSNIRLSVKGCTAWLTCTEEVYAPKFVRGKGKTRECVKKMLATNIFRKVGDRWFMVHHHASYGDVVDGPKGVGGSVLGSSSKADNNGGNPPTVKKVFMGSLADLLNGGLGGILGDDKNPGDADNANRNGNGETIIQLNGNILDDDDDDDEIDDDNDDDDDEDERLMIKQVLGMTEDAAGSKTAGVGFGGGGNVPKDALRQNCIAALRKLCNQGAISQKQKRLLLTDIITCSAKGEFSMVEVAFELLCGEGEDKDAAEEEFADQCRVFATSLPDVPPRNSSTRSSS